MNWFLRRPLSPRWLAVWALCILVGAVVDAW